MLREDRHNPHLVDFGRRKGRDMGEFLVRVIIWVGGGSRLQGLW